MMITRDFVMINAPKTGSTFAREMILQAYLARERRLDRRVLRKLRLRPDLPLRELMFSSHVEGEPNQHGRVEAIPIADRCKLIVSIARDPIDRFLSMYNFIILKRPREVYLPALRALMKCMSKNYPLVTPVEFYESWKCWSRRTPSMYDLDIGLQTMQFGSFFATDPEGFFKHLKENGEDVEGLVRFLPRDFTLMRNESLNQDVSNLLRRLSFSDSEIDFIRNHPRVLPFGIGRQNDKKHPQLAIEPELLAKLYREESLLYKLYSHYGANYEQVANAG